MTLNSMRHRRRSLSPALLVNNIGISEAQPTLQQNMQWILVDIAKEVP